MNEALLKVVVKMVDEMHVCTSAMHFVPRPLGPSGALSQLAKSYVKTLLSAVKDNSKVYLSCARTTILSYKTEVFLASQGL
jgi:hypothetical protein